MGRAIYLLLPPLAWLGGRGRGTWLCADGTLPSRRGAEAVHSPLLAAGAEPFSTGPHGAAPYLQELLIS